MIRELILTGQFIPGSKFKISELTSRFDVSLNVVREALDRL
ncbi:GntR family transcriptional regulator [Leclercia barmai]|nr:GntR family transcriptional regulator [Enterobacter hormaechei subsp. steigerwaltii]